jgi:hypothetical protein
MLSGRIKEPITHEVEVLNFTLGIYGISAVNTGCKCYTLLVQTTFYFRGQEFLLQNTNYLLLYYKMFTSYPPFGIKQGVKSKLVIWPSYIPHSTFFKLLDSTFDHRMSCVPPKIPCPSLKQKQNKNTSDKTQSTEKGNLKQPLSPVLNKRIILYSFRGSNDRPLKYN